MKNYRVRICIYDEDTGHEEPEVFTDEPLYVNEDEISNQAYRTQEKLKKVLNDKPLVDEED